MLLFLSPFISVVNSEAPGCALVDSVPVFDPKIPNASKIPLRLNALRLMEFGALPDPEVCSPMDCTDTNKVRVQDVSDCARLCSKTLHCSAWYTEKVIAVDDKYLEAIGDSNTEMNSRLSPTTYYICHIDDRKMASLEHLAGSHTGGRDCSDSEWPECIEKDVEYTEEGIPLWFDATIYGSDDLDGCTDNDCTFTDKYLVDEERECANTCYDLEECESWTVGMEDNLKKCWLRMTTDGKRQISGFISGTRSCASFSPISRGRWTQGNNQCWGGGYTEDFCCDDAYGFEGNAQCWNEEHTFEMCCLGQPVIR